jgi:hypothetical protein
MASLLLGLEPVIPLGDLTVLRKGRLAFSSHLIRSWERTTSRASRHSATPWVAVSR